MEKKEVQFFSSIVLNNIWGRIRSPESLKQILHPPFTSDGWQLKVQTRGRAKGASEGYARVLLTPSKMIPYKQ